MREEQDRLAYERPTASPIPRWQFRLLFLLVLINLAVTIQTAYVPGVSAGLKQWWADYSEARRMRALFRQASAWSAPPGTVVWEDDPEAAAKLRAGGNYNATQMPAGVRHGNYPFLAGWPLAAAAKPPAVASQLQRNFPIYDDQNSIPQSADDWAVLLLHGLKSPGGLERLVYVVVEAKCEVQEVPGFGEQQGRSAFKSSLRRRLRLVATACAENGSKEPRPRKGEWAELVVAFNWKPPWAVPWAWTPSENGKPGQIRVEPGNRFRFYAAQLDAADPSHFTIDYVLDGVPGKIHGRLKDDGSIELKPEAGALNGPHWNPRG
jgi:hypothetical protein